MILEEVAVYATDVATAYLSREGPDKRPLVMCLGFRPAAPPVMVMVVGSGMPAVVAATRQILLAEGCIQYAFVSEIWISPRLAAEMGIGAHLAADRKDGLSIIVGSRFRLMICKFFIRYVEGGAVELDKYSAVDSAISDAVTGGAWGQLLAPEFDAAGGTGYFDRRGWQPGDLPERQKKKECS